MSNIHEIAESSPGALATNGWDAVLALDHTEVNALFFQQYLHEGPTNPLPGRRLRVMLSVGESKTFWILDTIIGAPKWSFQQGNSNATLEMEMIKGSIIAFDPSAQKIQHVATIRPNESKLSGALELSKVIGKVDKLGTVVADLGASAYAPSIVGVDPDSILNTEIGNSITSFFKHNEIKFPIGTITPGSVESLMPTDFHFVTQQKPNSKEACVVLLIQTSGPAGSIAPLSVYPIADNHTAALLFSDRALFSGALPDSLNTSFKKFGVHFGGNSEKGSWITTSSGGGITVGQINHRNEEWRQGVAWSSDGGQGEAPVSITLNGFSLASINGKIVATWKCKQPQSWSVYHCSLPFGNMPRVCGVNSFQTSIQVDYIQIFEVAMKPGNDSIVAFNSQTPKLTAVFTDGPSGWESFWAGVKVPSIIADAIQTNLKGVLENFTLGSINTFALTSLLFPGQHAVHLKDVALQAGLYLTGSLSKPIALTPSSINLVPGQSIQFSIAGKSASDFLWQIKPNIGSIKAGLYTAPVSIVTAEVVVITAVSISDSSMVGSAMALVYESPSASGLAIAPDNCLVSPGEQIQFSITDANKKRVSVDWTLSPHIGQISPAFGQEGLYTFTAPTNVPTATEVSASAVNPNNHSQVGKAVIRLVPSTPLSVSPQQCALKYGASVELTSSINVDDADELHWIVYPVGSGMVVPKDGDSTKAIYTAPLVSGQGNQVYVVAYSITGRATGLGIVTIMLAQ
jgi:hypothetical protein